MRKVITLLAVLSCCLAAGAQQFLWDVDFKFGFDNREYASLPDYSSETVFGAYLAPKVGLGFGKGHSVYVGADVYKFFGKNDPYLDWDILLYYQYAGEHFKVNAGSFPRRQMSGYYPEAFFDTRLFFDGNIEGALLSYTRDWWRVEGIVDWTGCISKDTREKFSVYSYGQFGAAWLNFSYSFMMTHYANSYSVSGVVDNVWVYPHLASDLSDFLPRRMELRLKAGWMQTFQNDRRLGQGYVLPGGFQGEVALEYYGFGIRNTVYAGDNLMPFYDHTDDLGLPYGANLYYGDKFYSTDSGIYNRLEISYHYDFKDFLRLKVASVHHYDGHGWGWQQLIQLTVNLNNFQFDKPGHKPHKHHR